MKYSILTEIIVLTTLLAMFFYSAHKVNKELNILDDDDDYYKQNK